MPQTEMDIDVDTESNAFGLKLEKNAKLWSTYLSEAQSRDEVQLQIWNESMDVLLIFSGLFSAVVTAFLIDSYKSLQADNSQNTVQLIAVMTATLQTVAQQGLGNPNVSLPALPSTSTNFIAPRWSVWLNILWFSSLAITLVASLGAIFVKQLLQTYKSKNLSGNLEEQALRHRLRRSKLKNWHIAHIIYAIPSLIYVALAAFFAGMVIFLFTLNSSVAIVIAILGGLTALLFAITVFASLYDPLSPFQTPITSGLETVLLRLSKAFHQIFSPKTWLWSFAARDYPGVKRERKFIRGNREALFWDTLMWLLDSRNEESANMALEHIAYCQPSLREHGFEAHNSNGLMDRLEEKVSAPAYDVSAGEAIFRPQIPEMNRYLKSYCTFIRQMAIENLLKEIEGEPATWMSANAQAWRVQGVPYGLHYYLRTSHYGLTFDERERCGVLFFCLSTYVGILDGTITEGASAEAVFANYRELIFKHSNNGRSYGLWLLDGFSQLVVKFGWPSDPDAKIVAGILTIYNKFQTNANIRTTCALALGMYGMDKKKERKAFYKSYIDCSNGEWLIAKFVSSVFASCQEVYKPGLDPEVKKALVQGASVALVNNLYNITLELQNPKDINFLLVILDGLPAEEVEQRMKLIERLFYQPLTGWQVTKSKTVPDKVEYRFRLSMREFANFSFRIADYLAQHAELKKSRQGLTMIGTLVKNGFRWYEPTYHLDYSNILETLFANLADGEADDIRSLSALAISSFPLYWHSGFQRIPPWDDPARVATLCKFFEGGHADEVTRYRWSIVLDHLPKENQNPESWQENRTYARWPAFDDKSSTDLDDRIYVSYGLERNDRIYGKDDVAWDETVYRDLITALLPWLVRREDNWKSSFVVDEALVERLRAYKDKVTNTPNVTDRRGKAGVVVNDSL